MCGNEKKALKYARYYAEVQEIIKADLKIEQTADAYNKYRYRRNMEAEAKAYKSAIVVWHKGLLAFLMSLLIAIAVVGCYIAYKRKVKKTIREKDEKISRQDEIISQSNAIIEKQKEVIKEVTDRNTRLVRIRLQEHFEMNAAEIYGIFQKAARGEMELTDTDWKALFATIDKDDPNFRKRISESVGNINKKKECICYLIKIGLTSMEIKNVMNLPRSTAFRLTKELAMQLETTLLISPNEPAKEAQTEEHPD